MPFAPDLNSLLPENEPENRREFLVTKLAAGFALAVQPICAQTIVTDAKDLTAGEVKIPVNGGIITGYRACPAKGRGFPEILVVEETFGVQEQIRDVCRRLAHAGYCAVAPDLFRGQGDVSKVPDAQVMTDLDATANWAAKASHGDVSRLGIVGFGWGGRIVWLYAAHNPKLKAGASWYGRLEGEKNELTPHSPIDYAGAFNTPIIAFYGGKDSSIPQDSIDKMKIALQVVGNPSQLDVYAEAQRDFYDDSRSTYDKEAAQDAWKKMLAWFRKYGL